MWNVYFRGTRNVALWRVVAKSAKEAKTLAMIQHGLSSDVYLRAEKCK